MNRLFCQATIFLVTLAGIFPAWSQSQALDQIGVTLLRALTTNLNGSGIRVAQPEASAELGTNWEVNPVTTGQPTGLFTYYSSNGSANIFPNDLSSESEHADEVGQFFYGIPDGVATNVAHVDNYDADFYTTNYIFALAPMPAAPIVNQSFTFGPLSISDQQGVDSSYDDYSETFGTLFISPVANGGQVSAPGTSYNCIAVGAYGGGSSTGPTIDNARCKPDITAPAGATSFSTPQVAGAAAVLMQAALRGDGGSDTNAAFDRRTLKALLLNGAVKPADWTNNFPSPLDNRYGAGVLNVFNAYQQLVGGRQRYVIAADVITNSAHFPTDDTGSISGLNGWDFNTSSSSATTDGVNHYYFNVTNNLNSVKFIATATLVWNRQLSKTNINDLDLFLFNVANNNLVAASTSRVDNVEQIWLPQLPQGRYDLQVVKNGGPNVVSDNETYALAWAFVAPTLSIASSGASAILTWPAYPAGFRVETTTNLSAPLWTTNDLSSSVLMNNMNTLPLATTNALQFFRLRTPNF